MRALSAQIEREGPDRVAEEQAADSEARFAALVDRQARFVFRVAYVLLRNSQDAEDIVQETFVKIYRAGDWERVRDERAFLATIAWRLSVERIGKRRREKTREASVQEIQSSEPNPEQAAISTDWDRIVHALLDGLPEDLRQPLALSAVEDLSSREIAQVLGIADGTVRTRLMRGRQLLKQKLAAVMESRYER